MGYIVFSIGFLLAFAGFMIGAANMGSPDPLVQIVTALWGVFTALGLVLCALGLVIAAIRELPRG